MSKLRQNIKYWMEDVLPRRRMITHGQRSSKLTVEGEACPIDISLTFDDGPHPEWTPPVLDALDEAGWVGTFFVIGREAQKYPKLVQEIVERGHEIGNHSYAHREPDETGVLMFAQSVQQTRTLLKALTKQDVTLMRPPKGKLDVWKTRSLWRADQTIVLWNVDPRDYAMRSTETAVDWSSSYEPTTGDLVLLHDRLPYAAEIVRTLAALHGDAQSGHAQNGDRLLRSVGVSQWLKGSSLTSATQAVSDFLIS